MDLASIVSIIIAPSIGIARLGNSEDEYFLGPEIPGGVAQPAGGFKDKHGRIKRQGARFRLYGLDANGAVLGEIDADSAQVEWTVELANTKASWNEFHGRLGPKDVPRNKGVTNRASLNICPGPRSISGRNVAGADYRFDSGQFRGVHVPLGELRTDEYGRLIVLGGYGRSASVPEGNLISNYANNNDWHDDISDGPVNACIKLQDGRELKATGARVLCVPPKYTPEMENLVTLYDVLEYAWYGDAAIQHTVSFTRDIYPIMRRIANYPWVNALAYRGHSAGKRGDFLGPDMLAKLADSGVASRPLREGVFRRVRNPNLAYDSEQAKAEANYSYMPAMAGDNNGPTDGDPTQWLRIRPSQYAKLKAWASGEFEADWQGAPSSPSVVEEYPVDQRPELLTRAALLPCVGGAFFPGIEMTYISEDKAIYEAPFRLRSDIPPGGITQWMACPWQADFYECNTAWWPVARPDDVVTEREYLRVLDESTAAGSGDSMAQRLAYREPWARGLLEFPKAAAPGSEGDAAMVDLWSHLGFVVGKVTPQGERVYVETERNPYVGMDSRKFYYLLSNIDEHPDFLPKAKELAQQFLDRAWEMQTLPNFPDTDRFFPYSEEAFEARLDQIYQELVAEVEDYDPATDPIFKTREAVHYRILQMAPFNQNDGAWLHSFTPAGPLNEVDALQFGIWMDEAGDGNVSQSHCNVYTDLLHQQGIYLSSPRSRDYAMDPRFLDSAFTVPVMELALARFPQHFYPELLGFSLQLEWTVVSLKPTIKLLDYYGIDSRFYELHVGIDNAVSGHGAMAKRAVKLYLDRILEQGGEKAMQDAWRRIWTGFIAFDQTGTLFQDMAQQLAQPQSSAAAVADIIASKKNFGSQNHGKRKLGANYINDWFEDPPGFMQALVDGGYFVRGSVEQSSFFNFIGFEGPMYKVFTESEINTLKSWVTERCPMPGKQVPVTPTDVAVLMAETIEIMQLRQVNAPAHDGHKLRGKNAAGDPVEWSVTEWFGQVRDQGAPAVLCLMAALADPQNELIVPGNPDASRFVTALLGPAGAMGAAFDEIAPDSGGLTHRAVTIKWISEGCKLPQSNQTAGKRHIVGSKLPGAVYPRLRLAGNGAAH